VVPVLVGPRRRAISRARSQVKRITGPVLFRSPGADLERAGTATNRLELELS